MKRAALYVRVSTAEQKNHGFSVDTQIMVLKDYCNANGYLVHDIYNDAGISARKSYKNRPELIRMIGDCKRGVIDLVLFTRLDRFSRNVGAYYSIVDQMNGVPWKAVLEDYETETPDGVFKVNIMLSVAQSEADKTAARLRDSYQYRKAKGEWYGLAPIGYKKENKRLVKDPSTMNGVNALFRTYLSTYSTTKAIMAANECGVKFEYTNVGRILTNPVYSGIAKNGHICEGYITPKEYEMITEVKRSRNTEKTRSGRVYLFSGILTCGYCGRRISGKTRVRQKNGKSFTYVRYACDADKGTVREHSHLEISETKMETYLLNNLGQILDSLSLDAKVEDRESAKRKKEKKRLEGKLSRLKEIYIDGDVSKDEYLIRKAEIEQQIAAIPGDERPLPKLPDNWRDIYNDLSKARKQVFFKKIIRKIILTNENKDNPLIFFY